MDRLGEMIFSELFSDFTARCVQNALPASVPLSWGIDELGSPLYFGTLCDARKRFT
jgi:hypothetical protein